MFNFELKEDLKIYICGPTVYADSHLGHARAYIMFDILKRVSEHLGHESNIVMNITDIDDKTIDGFHKSVAKGIINGDTMKDYKTYVRNHEDGFHADMKSLNIIPPNTITRVTKFIPQIISFIEKMMDNGSAYSFEGSIWYNSTHADNPGTNNWKKPKEDFVLWKERKSNDKQIYYTSPFGEGRPGWHIECSAMATSEFGDHIHIHGGGSDLKFPHHHNEELQVKAYYNREDDWKWVDKWMHVGRLEVKDADGTSRKMGKSEKNFITIREYLKTNSAQQLRLIFLEQDYKKSFTYDHGQTPLMAKRKERQISAFLDWAYQLPESREHEEKSIIDFFEDIKKRIEMSLKNMKIHEVMNQMEVLQKQIRLQFSSKTLTLDNNCQFILIILNILGLDFGGHYLEKNDIEKKLVSSLHINIKHVIKKNKKMNIEDFINEIKKINPHVNESGSLSYNLWENINRVLDNAKIIEISNLIEKLYLVLDYFREKHKIADFQ